MTNRSFLIMTLILAACCVAVGAFDDPKPQAPAREKVAVPDSDRNELIALNEQIVSASLRFENKVMRVKLKLCPDCEMGQDFNLYKPVVKSLPKEQKP